MDRDQETAAGTATPGSDASPDVSGGTVLYEETLLPMIENVHRIDRKGLRAGLAWLAALPILLLVIRRLTDSSKVAFLIIWIIGMFIISAALIFIAYTDRQLMRFLDAVKTRVPAASDTHLEDIGLKADLEQLPIAPERLRGLLARRHARDAGQSEGEAADLRKLEEWLHALEQRRGKGERDAQHTQDHTH